MLRVKCNHLEKELLSSIIDPNDLDVQLDNVVLDQGVMTTITTIIQQQQHQSDIGVASSGIIALVKVKGILLYGPPGTGKTLLARVIAKSTGHNMIAIDPALIKDRWVGKTEQRIRAVFSLAQRLSPCIIFIDEVDCQFFRRKSDDRTWERAAITQFLQSMDGLVQDKRAPLVIGATNKPMDLDSAFLRRLPHKVSLGLPDTKARTQILLLLLGTVNLDHVDVDHLAAVTDGFSGADLKALCSQAALDWAVQQNLEFGQLRSEHEAPLTDEHFSKAFDEIKPGTSQMDLALLEGFTKRLGPTTRAGASQAHSDSPVEKSYYKVADAWTNFPQKAQKVIRWIDSQEPENGNSPYFWEKKLLSLLVDPQTIGACWSDLAVHPKTEREIKEVLNHHNNSCESTQSYGLLGGAHTGGALVYGPPGTGKTQLARVLAHESGTVVICATPADVMSRYWGEGPKAIQGLFNLGRLLAPSIIFLDEAESMFPARELRQHQHELSDINQLLHEMDGLTKSKETPFVLIATNLPGRLDTAVLRRVPSKFYLGLPTTEIRAQVFTAVLKDEILHSAVNTSQLALMTPGFTRSDIRTLCIQTAIICDEFVENGDNKGKRLLTLDMFVEALDMPDHFALSYTWGDPRTIYTDKNDIFSAEAWASPAFEIDCDGHAVSVATNLYTALLSIRGGFSGGKFVEILGEDRFHSSDAEYSYVWIDALCINQDDLQEKSNQIPIMDRIYSQARATIMWLGGGELLVKQGLSKTVEKLKLVVSRLREIIGPGNEDLVIDWCRVFDICDPKAFEDLGLEPVDLVDLVGWYLLFSRSWFKRAWIVQEWVLSPKCLFLCGTLMFSPETFSRNFMDFTRRYWTWQIQKLVMANILDPKTLAMPAGEHDFDSNHRDFPFKSKYRTLPLFRAKVDYGILAELDQSLIAIQILRDLFTQERSKAPPRDPSSHEIWKENLSIQQFRSRRCFDPRDKIYAFHGIFKTSDGRSIFPSPDYQKPVSEVYVEATRVIATDIGLSFLHFREYRSSDPHGLPSWVPDFQLEDGLLQLDNPFMAKHRPSCFMAAAGLGRSTLAFKENHKLGLAGCHVDTVIRPEPFRFGLGTVGSACRHLLETLGRIPEESLICMPPSNHRESPMRRSGSPVTSGVTKQSRYEVIWRTLVHDQRRDHAACHPAPSGIRDVLMVRLKGILRAQCGYIVAKDMMQLLDQMTQESRQSDDSREFFAKCSPMLELAQNFFNATALPEMESNAQYDRQTQVDGLFEMNAVVEVLQGSLPIESEERLSPKLWSQHRRLWERVRASMEARDYAAFGKAFKEITHALSSSESSAEAEEIDIDRFKQTRVLFATSGGRLGLIAGGIERGDEIWVIQGLNVPVALRCVGDGLYSLVGIVYVHGIMHGEAVRDSTDVVELDLV
ncbi:AAA family ATPase [Colletotrichum chrysophilum]|uniref:AAA family ATPase n=1 Tax=Colletotrichum chrysophilum TaxID=1836956 RepID=A0AAD9ED99_9PEZI|nr:AAA family ATPase [Colletotrichum chrysophilum]